MSLFDRIARVARGKVSLMAKGPSSPLDPAVREELENLQPRPAPAQSTRQAPRTHTSPSPRSKPRNPAEDPVPKTDLLGEPGLGAERDEPPKKTL